MRQSDKALCTVYFAGIWGRSLKRLLGEIDTAEGKLSPTVARWAVLGAQMEALGWTVAGNEGEILIAISPTGELHVPATRVVGVVPTLERRIAANTEVARSVVPEKVTSHPELLRPAKIEEPAETATLMGSMFQAFAGD